MEMQICPHCGVCVAVTTADTCPSCRRSFQEPPSTADNGHEPKTLRGNILKETIVCPGVGFAGLGWRRIAVAAYLASLTAVLLCGWLIIAPGPWALLAVVVMLTVTILLWFGELLLVVRAACLCPADAKLLRRPGPGRGIR
jgi:hypothetical protein